MSSVLVSRLFHSKQPVLIVMIKSDRTRRCPLLHLAVLSVAACGGDEEASAEAIGEPMTTSAVSGTAKAYAVTLLIQLISVNLNKQQPINS